MSIFSRSSHRSGESVWSVSSRSICQRGSSAHAIPAGKLPWKAQCRGVRPADFVQFLWILYGALHTQISLSLLLLYCNVTLREKFVFDEKYIHKHRPTVIPQRWEEICEFVCLLHGFESYSGEHIVTNTTEYRCPNAFFMMINAIDPVPSNSSA